MQNYYESAYRPFLGSMILEEAVGQLLHEGRGLYNYVLESKDKFLPDRSWQGLKVIDWGGGVGGVSLPLLKLGARVTLVDFSPTACEIAKELASQQGYELNTVVADVTHPDVFIKGEFDLAIDGHLLHCLPFKPERFSYHKLVQDHLNSGGIFIGETMVHRKKLFFPPGFRFDDDYVLWQMFADWTAVRRIADSLDLEDEFNQAKWKIIYFYYYGQYAVSPHQSFQNLPNDILPALVRFVLQKP